MGNQPSPRPHVLRAVDALSRLAHLFGERRRQLAREVGLTVGQWQVLEEIAEEDFMPSLFARREARSAPAVSKTLRALLEGGLIAATVSPQDGRQRDYALTAKGRRVLRQLQQRRREAMDAVWGPLPQADVERFSRLSTQLAERLEAYATGMPKSRGKRKEQSHGKDTVRKGI